MIVGSLSGAVLLPLVSYVLYWRSPPPIPAWNVEELRGFSLLSLGMTGAALGAFAGWSATALPQNNAHAGWSCIGCGVLFSFLLILSYEDIQKFDLQFWFARAGLPLLWSILLLIRGICLVRKPDDDDLTNE
jgi:hypothetical protein